MSTPEKRVSTLDEIALCIAAAQLDNSIIDRQFCEELRQQANLLEYESTVSRQGWTPGRSGIPETPPSCSAEGCSHDWRTPDACLLNIGGKWFCREHQPPVKDGHVRPVGYTEPAPPQQQPAEPVQGAE